MSDNSTAEDATSGASTPLEKAPEPASEAKTPKSRGRKIALYLLGAAVVLFIYFIFADRLTPYSPYGYVRTYLVEIGPEVSGTVSDVAVDDNMRVEEGGILFRLDRREFEIAVDAAEAQLGQAGQSIGANTAGVSAAQAGVTEAKANLANIQEQAARVLTLVEEGVYAQARADTANAELETAEAQVREAEANLQQAQEALGPTGEDNPMLQAALADLDLARLNLIRTTVHAPSNGVVTGLQLAPGQQANAGEAVMAFLDVEDVWIVSYLTENNLGLVRKGDRVEIALDVLPGRIYEGTVQSTGLGVAMDDTTSGGNLPSGLPGRSVTGSDLRFPARITFDGSTYPEGIRFGARASVIIYPTDNGLMNMLGWIRIRLSSLWNYVN
ncbi:MAG: HlyD family secretion protein [Pseudomonadota bacterium]